MLRPKSESGGGSVGTRACIGTLRDWRPERLPNVAGRASALIFRGLDDLWTLL